MVCTKPPIYTIIFSCAPQYVLAGMHFCKDYRVHVIIHICAKFPRKYCDYIRAVLEQLPFVIDIKFVTTLDKIEWRHPKWNQMVEQWSDYVNKHIIDATHMQDPRWQGLNRLKGDPRQWLGKVYSTI